jgi:glycosyltransferase involved in cell wall biosynthesis
MKQISFRIKLAIISPFYYAHPMNILIVHNSQIPADIYDSTERVIGWLGKTLISLGHTVTYLVKKGSECSFAKVIFWDETKDINLQIPEDIDIVHFHDLYDKPVTKPCIFTFYKNLEAAYNFHPNTVFISRDHARRHEQLNFVHHGIDFDEYEKPFWGQRRTYFHFLGNAALKTKNVKGSIEIASESGERLHVIGGTRVNFRMGLRITLSPNVRFHGMLGNDGKMAILNGSKGLIFPVMWHEPFSLAAVESLYFGCPIFSSPYGCMPEILGKSTAVNNRTQWNGTMDAYYSPYGCLSLKKTDLVEAIKNVDQYSREACHEYAVEKFSSKRMAMDYLNLYEKILNGKNLNEIENLLSVPNIEKNVLENVF